MELKKILESRSLHKDAIEQFEKMVRNARFEGANNRFSKLISDPEGFDELIKEISEKHKGDKKLPLIPEFLVNKKVENRKPLEEDPLKDLLMPFGEFM